MRTSLFLRLMLRACREKRSGSCAYLGRVRVRVRVRVQGAGCRVQGRAGGRVRVRARVQG